MDECDLCDRYSLLRAIENKDEEIEQLKACIAQQADQIKTLQDIIRNKLSQ